MIDGGVVYFGHSGLRVFEVNAAGEPTDVSSEIFIGEAPGAGTNIATNNSAVLEDVRKALCSDPNNPACNSIGDHAAIEISGCGAGASVLDHYAHRYTSIAHEIAVHTRRGVYAYPVKPGLVIGHEAVGVIQELGVGITGYKVGERVLVGAITPCGQCNYCLGGNLAQCGGAIGGWKFGNTINGAQAEYLLVPHAQANLARIPDHLRDEEVILLADIASTGFSASESAQMKLGDTVAVFAQGPIGLCATAGARLHGASRVFAIDSNPARLQHAKKMGADVLLNFNEVDPVAEIIRLTNGRGVDVAIEALGLQKTFENALRVLRPGGVLSSLGVYSGKLSIPLEPFAAGLGDHKIITTLCPGGKERMRRLMDLVANRRVDLTSLLTHKFPVDRITEAYKLFGEQREGVLKVAIQVSN